MSSKSTLRIVRPFDTVDAFLESDAWTVDRADMVLLGQEALPPDTSVRFQISLSSGESVVMGEGRVIGHVAGAGDRPAGLRVKFQKLDSNSKAVLKRALEMQRRGAKRPEPAASSPTASEPEAAPPPVDASPSTTHVVEPSGNAADALAKTPADGPDVPQQSGVRSAAIPPSAPGDREALLARLRERARNVSIDAFTRKRSTAAE